MRSFTQLCNRSFIGLMLSLFLLLSCEDKVEITRTYTVYAPVYMPLSDLRESVAIVEPQPLEQTGRFYLYQNYILISDPGKGIHIVDNADPDQPTTVKYVNLPGSFNFSVKNNILYTDSYMDLVLLDITDINNITELNRVEDIFMQQLIAAGYQINPDSGIVIGYEPKTIIEITDEDRQNGGWIGACPYCSYDLYFADAGGFPSRAEAYVALPGSSTSSIGIGGSMAAFTIVDDHLYTIDQSRLITFDISDIDNPENVSILEWLWGSETIFPYGDNLFVGSSNGMYIIDNSDPANPTLISTYIHILGCDPVVVEDDRAYVTIRGGTDCRGNQLNQLDVIDISNLNQPVQVATYSMLSPYGLGIDNNTLFLCEGEHGLKVFNAENDQTIDSQLIDHITDIDAFDVIPVNERLYLIGKDGLYQYDYSNLEEIELISKLEVNAVEP